MNGYSVNFSGNGDLYSCDWRWPESKPEWTVSVRDGVRWVPDGPLTEAGLQAILDHFGLQPIAKLLVLELVTRMSPEALVWLRRDIEARFQLPALEKIISNRVGLHIPAEQAT